MSERNRGILTGRDRGYLRGDRGEEWNDDYERRVRQEIRNRVLNAIVDFWIIEKHLAKEDLQQIFHPDRGKQSAIQNQKQRGLPETWYTLVHEEYRTGSPLQEMGKREEPGPATTVFEEALKDAISFFYQGVEQLPGVDFERVIEEGMTKAVREHGKTASVEIDTRTAEMDILMKKAEEGELNREEIRLILDQEDGE